MKKLLAILLSTVLLLACVPLGAIPTMAAVEEKAAVRYAVSGDLNVPKPTKDDIRAVWKSVTHDTDVVYVEEPHTSAPYSTGELTDEFLDNGLTYLNAVRYVAGVPSVQLDAEKNESAQYGAVVLAAVPSAVAQAVVALAAAEAAGDHGCPLAAWPKGHAAFLREEVSAV